MIQTIQSDKLTVKIQETGAELMSLQTRADGCEYLWQGDGTYWSNRATVLFPICGRLYGGKYTWQRGVYEMVIHGIAKSAQFSTVMHTGNAVTMEFRSDEETKKVYPFSFIFRVTYTVEGLKLTEKAEVVNDGEGVLPFSFGGHPGFNVPLGEKGGFEDYYLEFSGRCVPERLGFSETCFLNGKNVPFKLEGDKTLRLRHDLFDQDAIFLQNMADSVTLKSDKTTKSVTVSYPEFVYLGFWHRPKTEAPYVCIEPWCGIPSHDGKVDDFADKTAMYQLAPGKSRTFSFSITLTE